MKKLFLLTLVLLFSVVVAYGLNPVLVDSGGTGNFLTVQSAINSWCPGGANIAEIPPFVINIKAGSGPYDESLTLQDADTVNRGDIVGNLEIKSDTPGSKIVIKLKKGPVTPDDGIYIYQNIYDVTFRDIVFCPSRTAVVLTDDMVKVDETSANTVFNWVNFYDCVFTDVTTAGDPMVTDKASALIGPPPTRGSGMASGDVLLKSWGDNGETRNLRLDNCVFYGGASYNCQFATDGTIGEQVIINNCLNNYSGYVAYYYTATALIGKAGVVTFSGTDQTAGPLNCNAVLNPLAAGHCIWAAPLLGATVNVSHSLLSTGAAGARGISGGANPNITVSDTIISAQTICIVDNFNNAATWDRVTLHTIASGNALLTTAVQPGSLTVRDCIFSGLGTKISGAGPTGGISIDYSSFVEAGPDAITARDSASGGLTYGANIINTDPIYLSKDATNALCFDVDSGWYGGKGTSASNLAGGADYAGGTPIGDWSIY